MRKPKDLTGGLLSITLNFNIETCHKSRCETLLAYVKKLGNGDNINLLKCHCDFIECTYYIKLMCETFMFYILNIEF